MFTDYRDLLKKGFSHGGRGPETFDCWGLCIEILKRMKKNAPELPTPDDMGERHDLIAQQKSFLAEELNGPEEGAVVLLRVIPKYITHCGVCLGDGRFIHILAQSRVTVERLNSPWWRDIIQGYYRIK
jgi:cell wall-associated NlpC family hydrolase